MKKTYITPALAKRYVEIESVMQQMSISVAGTGDDRDSEADGGIQFVREEWSIFE